MKVLEFLIAIFNLTNFYIVFNFASFNFQQKFKKSSSLRKTKPKLSRVFMSTDVVLINCLGKLGNSICYSRATSRQKFSHQNSNQKLRGVLSRLSLRKHNYSAFNPKIYMLNLSCLFMLRKE